MKGREKWGVAGTWTWQTGHANPTAPSPTAHAWSTFPTEQQCRVPLGEHRSCCQVGLHKHPWCCTICTAIASSVRSCVERAGNCIVQGPHARVWRPYLIAASTHSHVLLVSTMDVAWYTNTLAIQAIGGIPTIPHDDVQMWTGAGAWKKKIQYVGLYIRSKGRYTGTQPEHDLSFYLPFIFQLSHNGRSKGQHSEWVSCLY